MYFWVLEGWRALTKRPTPNQVHQHDICTARRQVQIDNASKQGDNRRCEKHDQYENKSTNKR